MRVKVVIDPSRAQSLIQSIMDGVVEAESFSKAHASVCMALRRHLGEGWKDVDVEVCQSVSRDEADREYEASERTEKRR